MITVIPFDDLGRFENDWLDAHHHFSFADYHDPARMGLGPLRVWNDDTIRAHTGFEPHPHKDMEIITYVRSGAISHEDSLGNRGVTGAGDVQVMSAGSGVVHSEKNETDESTTLFQIWIQTDAKNHPPRWDARKFPNDPVQGALPVLASGRIGQDAALMIHQDASVLGGRIDAGDTVRHTLEPDRAAYLVPSLGRIEVNGTVAEHRAGITVTDEAEIVITALKAAEVVLVDVAA